MKRIINFFRRLLGRWLIAKSSKSLEPVVQQMILDRKKLRRDINSFLVDFFGVKGRSKFIPPDYKNSEEVRIAILDKFSPRMKKLNVTYNDLFK